MKKVASLLAICLSAHVFAADPQGIFAQVELVSGTTQKAQFLGIANDTVSLGGYIKNQFTIVKFPKSQFKSIVDEQGNDLLNPAKATPDSAMAADSSVAQSDSALTSDSTIQDTATASLEQNNNDSKREPAKVFISFEPSNIGATQQELIGEITYSLLHELDSAIQMHRWDEIAECNDRNCIQEHWKKAGANEIYFGKLAQAKHPDSIEIALTRILYEEDLPTITRTKIVVSRDSMLQDALKGNAITNFVKKANGKQVSTKAERSYIHVETDPEAATISRPQKDAICKSPCTFAVTDTGKIEVNAYWNVDKHLWGAQTFVRPLPGDTAKVSLKLKRINPEIKIVSNPVGAEIFPGQDEITNESLSIGYTPKKVTLTTPGMTYLHLRKAGYRDTLVSFYVAPVPEINLDISMEHLTDFEEIKTQEEWFQKRKRSFIGKVLMGSSVTPVLLGSLFFYLASQDYDEAKDIKNDLSMPSAAKGENFNAKIKKNHDLVESGDRYSIIGGSLIGTGIALFTLGFILTF
ncbi:MAG: hypothetical protein IK012_12295 [Fibrobacter sp.]|uniref:hypothetical protein n=1 Tax=Fibrobacter sp. TaxID=35828 RepID=UPI0025C60A5A|nr:hypothetical protein [Fibrobacter sp.]MBR4786011.1 hypothetical protein [Fibrobacter sp.]